MWSVLLCLRTCDLRSRTRSSERPAHGESGGWAKRPGGNCTVGIAVLRRRERVDAPESIPSDGLTSADLLNGDFSVR